MSKKQSSRSKVNYEAPNLFAERLVELKSIFPEVFSEGRIDFDKLKTALGEEIDAKPEECVFIDDRVENIEGARKLGIHGIVFENKEQLKKDLEKLGVKVE